MYTMQPDFKRWGLCLPCTNELTDYNAWLTMCTLMTMLSNCHLTTCTLLETYCAQLWHYVTIAHIQYSRRQQPWHLFQINIWYAHVAYFLHIYSSWAECLILIHFPWNNWMYYLCWSPTYCPSTMLLPLITTVRFTRDDRDD